MRQHAAHVPRTKEMGLPPGCIETEDGRLIRRIPQVSADGTEWLQERRVALTLDEAKAKRWDWYHPQLGWVHEGYKLEVDRTPQSIMADNSVSIMAEPPEDETLNAPITR